MKLQTRWHVGLLGVVVSLLAVYFIVSQMDMRQLADALQTARYGYVLPCIALLVLGLATRAVRWRVLLSDGLPLARAFSILNVSYLVNGVLPLRMGEVARVFLATRVQPPVPVFKSASTIIVERLLDLLAVLVLLALAASVALPGELRAAGTGAGVAVVVGFLVLIALANQRERTLRWLGLLVGRFAVLQRWNLAGWLGHFLDGLAPLTKPLALANALLWTAISWVLSVAAGYVLMYAFYDRADWATACLFIAAASFAIALPAVPGNIGTYEWSILLALRAMGYGEPAETAIAFAVLVHGVNLFVYALTGVIGFMQEGISLGQLSQGVRQMQQTNAG